MKLTKELNAKTVKHPISAMSKEIKLAYLKMVAFTCNADDEKNEKLMSAFENILFQSNCIEAEELVSFFNNPNLDEFETALALLQEQGLDELYMLDTLWLMSLTKPNNDKSEYIAFLVDKLSMRKEVIDILQDFFIKMQNGDTGEATQEIYKQIPKYGHIALYRAFLGFYNLKASVKVELRRLIGEKQTALMQENLQYNQERSAQSWAYVNQMLQLSKSMMHASDTKFSKLEAQQKELEEESEAYNQETDALNKEYDEVSEFWNEVQDCVA